MPTDEMFGLRRNCLRTVTYQLRNRRLIDDGQLPTGWHLLTYWHFTAEILRSAALRAANAERRQTFHPRQSVNPSGIVFALAR